MLGYCGIDCSTCRGYQGTVKADVRLLEEVAGDAWEGQFSATDWVCLGCRPADQPFLAKYCSACRIRACAIERGVSNCALCEAFEGCPTLEALLQTEPEALRRTLALLRGRCLAGRARTGRSAPSPS